MSYFINYFQMGVLLIGCIQRFTKFSRAVIEIQIYNSIIYSVTIKYNSRVANPEPSLIHDWFVHLQDETWRSRGVDLTMFPQILWFNDQTKEFGKRPGFSKYYVILRILLFLTHLLRLCLVKILIIMRHKLPDSHSKL